MALAQTLKGSGTVHTSPSSTPKRPRWMQAAPAQSEAPDHQLCVVCAVQCDITL